MTYTIKQTAEITGLTTDTLRYYEKLDVISSKRHENGYRYYDEDDISIIKTIVVMKYAHFTLDEIKNMMKLFKQEPTEDCNTAGKQILSLKINELEQKIQNYQQIVEFMKELLPLINCIGNTLENEEHVDRFIELIFNDVKNTALGSNSKA